MAFWRCLGSGTGKSRREMGLVGKSTDLTALETMPVTVRRPRGMRTIWPGVSLTLDE